MFKSHRTLHLTSLIFKWGKYLLDKMAKKKKLILFYYSLSLDSLSF